MAADRRSTTSPNYTPEAVWEADAGILTLGENELRELVSFALCKVPKRVADKVFKGCIFVMAKFEWGAGTYIPKELLRGKCVIALSERLMDEPREAAIHTILHEVAHFYLRHMPPGLMTEPGEGCDCRQEEEAEAQVKEWLKADRRARRAH
jgi:SprT-like family